MLDTTYIQKKKRNWEKAACVRLSSSLESGVITARTTLEYTDFNYFTLRLTTARMAGCLDGVSYQFQPDKLYQDVCT